MVIARHAWCSSTLKMVCFSQDLLKLTELEGLLPRRRRPAQRDRLRDGGNRRQESKAVPGYRDKVRNKLEGTYALHMAADVKCHGNRSAGWESTWAVRLRDPRVCSPKWLGGVVAT